MKSILLAIYIIIASTQGCTQASTVVKPPAALPEKDNRTKVFLGGSIDMGNADNWQGKVESQLAHKSVLLFNPRRSDWNKDWQPVSTDPNFRQQVEWELNALEKADFIIMYFAPNSQSPISLMELGLYANTNKLMVVCPEGYWRKGNVDIVCEKYKIATYTTLDLLLEDLNKKIK